MKKLFIMFAVVAMSMTAAAQSTRVIRGAVIDKNGNPLPGATVEATGGSEVTTVDADGTFSMEVPMWLNKATARYAGMRNNTMKINGGDLIFRMKNASKKQWYLMANYGRIISESYVNTNTGGLMAGFLGKWGWYSKLNFGSASVDSEYDEYSEGEIVGNFSTGVSKRIIPQLHAYIGIGFGVAPVGRNYSYYYDYDRYYCSSEVAVFPEIGFIAHLFNHLTINASYSPMIFIDDDDLCHGVQVGVGYAF